MLRSFSLAAIVAVAAVPSFAATITGLTPTSVVIDAPETVTDSAPGSNQAVLAFSERGGVILPEDLMVIGGTLAAGTRVDSHMILLNRADAAMDVVEVSYGFQFGGQIAGVIGASEDVAATHGLLGAAGTTYGQLHRLEGDDRFEVRGDRITGFMRVMQPGDWFRVLTVTDTDTDVLSSSGVPAPVPTPAAGGLMALALGALIFKRRAAKGAHA